MPACGACKKDIDDGLSIVIVTDAMLIAEGEVEHGDTEYYHTECITIDY